MEYMSILMFLVVCVVLLFGFPVAYSLAGTAILFAGFGMLTGQFEQAYLNAVPSRLYGILTNQTLIAVPLFVFMGVALEKSKVAENLLNAMTQLFGQYRGGLAISVILVGALLAASTGIVGATVVTMGLLSLPTMLKQGYAPSFATGSICATGTLGQIIPPSIALVLLGDVLSSAYQRAQLNMGIFSPESVSVGDLFVGAIVPGAILVSLYLIYVVGVTWLQPHKVPRVAPEKSKITWPAFLGALLPPLLLIFLVLGAILGGFATPTEAAGVGAAGSLVLAVVQKQLSLAKLKDVMLTTTKVTSMVFLILIGASIFSLVFRGFGGEELIEHLFNQLPGGVFAAVLVVMLVIFVLGFILDFIEITFVVVPLVAPVLLAMGIDPIWLGIMIAVNLQTSFLTPPFGFALFYLRGVAPNSVQTTDIYKGVIPFIILQVMLLIGMAIWPSLVTWLPAVVYG
ncbi:TRAP transporter large permease [Paraglaciecola sp. 2405UD69-4]|uniref:TRAP transporter large permease n=1 Tax=Paraglaciecola sp. 2405UD69-4 TaxID=3391836 RepID=UPI0039C91BCA